MCRSSHQSCSIQKVVLKILQILQENTFASVSFQINLQVFSRIRTEYSVSFRMQSECGKGLQLVSHLAGDSWNICRIVFRIWPIPYSIDCLKPYYRAPWSTWWSNAPTNIHYHQMLVFNSALMTVLKHLNWDLANPLTTAIYLNVAKLKTFNKLL